MKEDFEIHQILSHWPYGHWQQLQSCFDKVINLGPVCTRSDPNGFVPKLQRMIGLAFTRDPTDPNPFGSAVRTHMGGSNRKEVLCKRVGADSNCYLQEVRQESGIEGPRYKGRSSDLLCITYQAATKEIAELINISNVLMQIHKTSPCNIRFSGAFKSLSI